eukprot:3369420-Rhodomonas_salina.2
MVGDADFKQELQRRIASQPTVHGQPPNTVTLTGFQDGNQSIVALIRAQLQQEQASSSAILQTEAAAPSMPAPTAKKDGFAKRLALLRKATFVEPSQLARTKLLEQEDSLKGRSSVLRSPAVIAATQPPLDNEELERSASAPANLFRVGSVLVSSAEPPVTRSLEVLAAACPPAVQIVDSTTAGRLHPEATQRSTTKPRPQKRAWGSFSFRMFQGCLPTFPRKAVQAIRA